MGKTRTRVFVAGALGLGLALTGCASGQGGDSGDGGDATGEVKVAYLVGHVSDFTKAQLAGVERAGAEQGAAVDLVAAEDSSADGQDKKCQDIVTAKTYDAIVLDAADGQALTICAEEAIAAGIPVVSGWTALGPDPRSTEIQIEGQAGSVVLNPEEYYGQMFDIIVNACEGIDPCKVVSVIGFKGYTPENIRVESWEERVQDHPNIEFVAWGEDAYDAASAVPVATDLLRANPDASVYTGSGDTTTVAVIPVLEELGLIGKVKLIGDGASERGLEAVKNGDMYGTVPLFPNELGYQAGLRAIAAAKGEAIPDPAALNVNELFPELPRIIDQSNADLFTAEW
ncbi:sugar ABC transporter substrate-binding protein [Leucobacter soli]|uniref:Periplasmic binding protein domain-containing protein n=1 Tax=Leucobacter soli TaxID=2812850 RepID=A0A916JWI6_9MICO|nr:sugar ABC transporter substrate-binding protein [Leucobacter soli]CAG7610327.1 hypothetical protein LEUCIP111803_01299 [Leucobacter soli]